MYKSREDFLIIAHLLYDNQGSTHPPLNSISISSLVGMNFTNQELSLLKKRQLFET